MLKIFRDAVGTNITVTHNLDTEISSYMDRKLPEVIIDRLVDLWVEKYGAELLKELAPQDVAEAVKKKLEEKIASKVFDL